MILNATPEVMYAIMVVAPIRSSDSEPWIRAYIKRTYLSSQEQCETKWNLRYEQKKEQLH